MARIRTVKPEFWTSEQVVECSPTARLLFIGMWNFCDDGGVIPYSPLSIKMKVFPGDACDAADIGSWMSELERAGLIQDYQVDGRRYLKVTGWSRHQKIDKPTYRHPQPLDEGSTRSPRDIDEASPPEGKGREGKLKPLSGSTTPDLREDLFNEARKHGPLHPNDNRPTALKAWKARVRAGESPEALRDGWIAYRAWCESEGTQRKHIKHQATFYGPDRHWEMDYAPAERMPDDIDAVRALAAKHPEIDVGEMHWREARKVLAGKLGMTL